MLGRLAALLSSEGALMPCSQDCLCTMLGLAPSDRLYEHHLC